MLRFFFVRFINKKTAAAHKAPRLSAKFLCFPVFCIPMFCQFLTGFGGHLTVSAACLCSNCTKVCSSGRRVPLSG